MKKGRKKLSFILMFIMMINIMVPVKALASNIGELAVNLKWSDNENKEGKRPASVDIELYQSGILKGTKTLNTDNKWSYKWTGLATTEKNKVLENAVKVKSDVKDYTFTEEKSVNAVTITGTYKVEEKAKTTETTVPVNTPTANVEKQNTQEVKVAATPPVTPVAAPVTQEAAKATEMTKPTEAPVEATKAPEAAKPVTAPAPAAPVEEVKPVETKKEEAVKPVVPKAETMKQQRTIENPSNADPKATVPTKETQPAKQEAKVEPTKEVKNNTEEKINFIVELKWDDQDNKGKLRPENIEVQLGKNHKASEQYIKLNKDNNWKYTWKELPKYENNKEIVYSALLSDNKDYNFEKTIKPGVVNITAKLKEQPTKPAVEERINLTVEYKWDDLDNKAKLRPSFAQVQLQKDGKTYGNVTKLESSNNWTYTWKDLEKYEDGKEVKYTVVAVNASKDYNITYDLTGKLGTIIVTGKIKEQPTEPQKVDVSVEYKWDDLDNKARLRPGFAQVQLQKDGKTYGNVTRLENSNNWKYTWKDLPKYENGKEVKYTVVAINISNDYTVSYDTSKAMTTVVTAKIKELAIENQKISITVEKIWNDSNDKDKYRPTSVKIQLNKNGKALNEDVTVDRYDDWKYTWKNLPKYEDGKEIKYTVTELNIPKQYTAKYSVDYRTGNLIITNTISTGSSSLSGTSKTLPKTGSASTIGITAIGIGLIAIGFYQFRKKKD